MKLVERPTERGKASLLSEAETQRRETVRRAREKGDAYRATKPGALPFRKRARLDETLNDYSGMIKGKAREFARRYSGRVGAGFLDELEDFKQAGRIGAWRAFEANARWPSYRPTVPPAYFRAAVVNSMKDLLRRRERPNSEVWEYDHAAYPTQIERYRYRGRKARIRYNDNGFTRLTREFIPPIYIDEEDEDGWPRWEIFEAVAPDGQGRTWKLAPTGGGEEKI